MALDDRDRRFEKALARQLPVVCADSETLAAYHERLLSPEELNSWKSHIAGCMRCQEVLAQLEATDEVVETELERDAVPAAAAAPIQAVDFSGAKAMAAARASVASMDRVEPKARRPASVYAKWLAPAGAIAAGLLLWIVVQGRKPALPPGDVKAVVSEKETEPKLQREAEKSPAAAPSQEVAINGTEPGDKLKALTKQQGARAGAARQESGRLLDEGPSSTAQLPMQSRNTATLQPLERDALNEELRAGAQAKPKEGRAADLKTPAREQNAMVALAPGVAATLEPAPMPATPPPLVAPAAKAEGADQAVVQGTVAPENKKDQAAASAVSESVEVTAAATPGKFAMARSRVKKQENARIVPAPGGNTVWSIGSGGVILRSTNGGKKWKEQPSGVDTDLAAGSAATDAVCWLVGARGTILLTTDGGNHWTKLAAPINGDIGGVFAVDAVHAMIWDAANHQSFETDDGGRTWKPSTTP